MANNTLDKAIAAVPEFGKRIQLFTKKLRLVQYADDSTTNGGLCTFFANYPQLSF